MSVLVMYFTRTGNSKRIAEKIKSQINCDVVEIKDDKNWNGILGFIRGGFYCSFWKQTNPIINPDIDIAKYSRIVFISPVWASNVAPAVYSFIMNQKERLNDLTIILSNDGSEIEPAFKKIESKLGIIQHKFGITKKKNNEDEEISKIVDSLIG